MTQLQSGYTCAGYNNTSLHVFQWQPFTVIRVLHEYNTWAEITKAETKPKPTVGKGKGLV